MEPKSCEPPKVERYEKVHYCNLKKMHVPENEKCEAYEKEVQEIPDSSENPQIQIFCKHERKIGCYCNKHEKWTLLNNSCEKWVKRSYVFSVSGKLSHSKTCRHCKKCENVLGTVLIH